MVSTRSAIYEPSIKSFFLLKKDFPICFILNEKEMHKCMNGPPDHFAVFEFRQSRH